MPYLRWPDVDIPLLAQKTLSAMGQGIRRGWSPIRRCTFKMPSMRPLEASTKGRWRVFSKLGFGYSRGGEFVNAGYACIPVFDDNGDIKTDWGKEFFIVTQMGANEQYHQSDAKLAQIYKDVVTAVRRAN